MRHRNAFTWVELLVVLAIIAILIALLWPAIHAARMIGDPRLTRKPEETQRVFHPSGFSMIRPQDWRVLINDESPNLESLAFIASGQVSHYAYEIRITTAKTIDDEQIPTALKPLIDPSTFKATTFQNQKAFESVEKIPSIRRRVPNQVYGRIYFFRDGKCYLLRYRFYDSNWKVPENLPLYLDSFRTSENSSSTVLKTEE